MNKFRRTKFIPTENVNGKLERDMILNDWDLFKIKRPISFNTIKRIDIQRPDILSLRIYGYMNYWWILCKVNNIDDVWNDMYVGMDIMIPDIRDIEDWYISVKARTRK